MLLALSALSCGGEKAKEQSKTNSPTTTPTAPTKTAGGAIAARVAMQLLWAKAGGWASDAMPVTLGPIARDKTAEGGKREY